MVQAIPLDDALSRPRQVGLRVSLEACVTELSDEAIGLLHQIVAAHGVVCLDRQPVTPRQLVTFAGRWGEIVELPAGLAHKHQEPGLTSITRVGNVRTDGSIIPGVRFAEYWHHDGDFWAPGQNYILNFLSGVHVPSVGGHTGFLDTRRACDLLTDAQRADLDGAYICVRASEIDDFAAASANELPPDVRHAVLSPHPSTRQFALYLPDSSTGVQTRTGEPLGAVNDFVDAIGRKIGIVEHRWAVGDLVIVDNLQVMHRSMGGYGDLPRLLYRCQARIRCDAH
jgi:taurine dioxygenase